VQFFYSVGGADYGSVRVGTFMGRQIIKSTASTILTQAAATSQEENNGVICDVLDEHDPALLEKEAKLDYLCNLQPHRHASMSFSASETSLSNLCFRELVQNVLHAFTRKGLKSSTRSCLLIEYMDCY